MKTIGLIGGMSWESSAIYYRRLNEIVRERRGGLHSARLVMASLDFADIEALQRSGDWAAASKVLADTAQSLERAGAECVLICTNTMHICAGDVAAAVETPLLHIADAAAEALKDAGCARPLLLGTRYTMEKDFYVGRMARLHGLDGGVPPARERAEIDRVSARAAAADDAASKTRVESLRRETEALKRAIDAES